jgi:hypothetical protein
VVLMHPAEHISMAAIFRACKANRLQWYLGPPPGDKEEKQRSIGEVVVPDLPLDKLQGELLGAATAANVTDVRMCHASC